MRHQPRILSRIACIWTLLLVAFSFSAFSYAQAPTNSDSGGSDPISTLKGMKHKTLVIVFDVSGSMNDHGNLRRARLATIDLLRQAVLPGDHVALLTFGAGNKTVFDTTVKERAEISDLVEKVPTHTEDGAGTNIREPHHTALKMVDADQPNPGAIVLLTDSFNDEPKPADAAYPDYLKYYTPGGQLTKYPKTSENRDYERLLHKLLASGNLTQFGIGIGIAPNGRPIERLPVAATATPEPTDVPSDSNSAPIRPAPPESPVPYIVGGILLVAAIAAGIVLPPMFKATSVRITGGAVGAKDFLVKSGQTIRLGGDGASASFDAYPLPSAKNPAAIVRGARAGQLFIAPAPVTGNQTTPPRVYHNGLPLEHEEPLRYGDEVRISLPTGDDSGTFREHRLKFEDPRKTF